MPTILYLCQLNCLIFDFFYWILLMIFNIGPIFSLIFDLIFKIFKEIRNLGPNFSYFDRYLYQYSNCFEYIDGISSNDYEILGIIFEAVNLKLHQVICNYLPEPYCIFQLDILGLFYHKFVASQMTSVFSLKGNDMNVYIMFAVLFQCLMLYAFVVRPHKVLW